MVLIFAKQQVLPNSSTPLVPPTILGNFICKCNTNAIGGQLLHGWQWFMGWSMPIPTPIKAIMTLLAFQQMPNLSTTSSSQYIQMQTITIQYLQLLVPPNPYLQMPTTLSQYAQMLP